jgi:hypothetical protein
MVGSRRIRQACSITASAAASVNWLRPVERVMSSSSPRHRHRRRRAPGWASVLGGGSAAGRSRALTAPGAHRQGARRGAVPRGSPPMPATAAGPRCSPAFDVVGGSHLAAASPAASPVSVPVACLRASIATTSEDTLPAANAARIPASTASRRSRRCNSSTSINARGGPRRRAVRQHEPPGGTDRSRRPGARRRPPGTGRADHVRELADGLRSGSGSGSSPRCSTVASRPGRVTVPRAGSS